jgi:hypothetical protein
VSYWDISLMAADADLTSRVSASAAQEGKPDPRNWAADHMLVLAASPGWSEAWASALAADPPNPSPGRDAGVITDGMILSAIQAQPAT